MYIYLMSAYYEGSWVIDSCNDQQAIDHYLQGREVNPSSERLYRVHNTGTEIIREEYISYSKTWEVRNV